MSKVGAASQLMVQTHSLFVRCLAGRLLLAFAICIACHNALSATPLVVPQEADQFSDLLQQLPTDRRVVQQVEALAAAIRSDDLPKFRELLQTLRDAEPSLMVPSQNNGFVPLHRALTELLSSVTGDFRRQLEADDVLAKASYSGSLRETGVTGLVRLLHQHSGTSTALRIHLLLARVHEDRGQRLTARYWLSPLRTANIPAELQEAVRELSARVSSPAGASDVRQPGASPSAPTPAGSDPGPADPAAVSPSNASSARPDESNSVTRVTGAEQQQAAGAAIPVSGDNKETLAPRHLHWVQSMPGSALERETFRLYVERSEQRNFIPWTSMEPELDAERIYVRLPEILVAFDRTSGRPLWTRPLNTRAPIDEEVVNEMQQALQRMRESSRLTVSPDIVLRSEILSRMTSDSRHVYTIVETSNPGEQRSREEGRQLRMLLGRAEAPAPAIRELIAFDKQTGRRVWTVGGAAIEQRYGNELSNAWLAGPPTVRGERLYLVIEKQSVISLACLSAATGQVQWLQPLVYPETAIEQDPARELYSARTIEHEGAILTSTTTGWVVALDSLTGTTLWAQRCPARENLQPRISRGGRRLPMMRAEDIRPHDQTWRTEDPVLYSDKVLWSLAECSRLFSLDAETGRVRWVEAAKDFTVLLHQDPQLIVVASGLSIKALQLPAMTELWKHQRKAGSPVPVGEAASFGQQLLVPLSDGSVEVRDRNSGSILDVLARVRFGRNTGGLLTDAAGVISYGFDHLAVFGQQPPGELNTEDFVQQAAFLLESDQLDAAEQALARAPESTLNRSEIRKLKFRMALTRLARGGETVADSLNLLEQAADSPRERAISHLLRVDEVGRLNPSSLPQLLQHRLRDSASVLAVELPEPDLIRRMCRISTPADLQFFGYSSNGTSTRQTPLKAWLLNRWRELLQSDDLSLQQQMVAQSAQLSDAELCGLHSALLIDECLRRVEQQIADGRISEQTLHLLFTAIETADSVTPAPSADKEKVVGATAPERAEQFTRLLQALGQVGAAEGAGTLPIASRRLLQTVVAELQGKFAVQSEGTRTRLNPALHERWTTVDQGEWKMVPLSTVGLMNARPETMRFARPVTPDDSFLGSFNCLLRRDTGLFQLQDLQDMSGQPWSHPLLHRDPSLLDSDLEISRCGSVLLLAGRASLSALSVLDHRWLWTRQMISNSYGTYRMPEEGFTEYTADQGQGVMHDSGRRLCGSTNRWLCVRTDRELEVLDLLTGERLWSIQVRGLSQDVFACDKSIILRDGGNGREAILDPVTGHSQMRKRAALRVGRDRSLSLPTSVRLSALVSRIIRAAGPNLVVWDSEASFDDVRTIDWVNAETLNTEHSVPLPGLVSARFLSRDHLIAFTSQEQALLVNLATRNVETLNFHSDDPGVPPLRPDRLNACVDADNVFVFETRPSGGRGMMIPAVLSNSPRTEIHSQIRAIDRLTGTLRWTVPLPQPRVLTLDQQPGPLLLVLEMTEQNNGGNGNPNIGLGLGFGELSGFRLNGYSRQTGRKLIEYPVVAQFPVSAIRVQLSSTDQLDLEIFGNRVRLLKTAAEPQP
ncbi:MAG: hypothetical protein RLZZ232_3504 [Planctomycetota bacterium]